MSYIQYVVLIQAYSKTVLDKNGEELLDTIIKKVSTEEKGLVELLGNNKHKFEDGDECTFENIEGMKVHSTKKENQNLKSPDGKPIDSINGTIHKVTVVSPYSFRIGDTR